LRKGFGQRRCAGRAEWLFGFVRFIRFVGLERQRRDAGRLERWRLVGLATRIG
jgi:hypothetical protein